MNEPTANRPVGKIISIVVAVLFGAYVFYSVATDDANGDGHLPEISNGDAWGLCKDAVREELRNPGSADFALLSTDISEQPDGGYSIAGSLSAVNDFGVEQEIGFSCRVSPDGQVRANVS